jgi:hypothetical protein
VYHTAFFVERHPRKPEVVLYANLEKGPQIFEGPPREIAWPF